MQEPKMCTTSGRPVDEVRADQTETIGQHKDYIVLCPDERAKGFVRPYRDKYIHVGPSICAEIIPKGRPSWESPKLGGPVTVCGLPFGHEGDHGEPVRLSGGWGDAKRLQESHRRNGFGFGCGVETKMGQALSETYARDPSFYGATFCVRCNRHLPVNEFVWSQDGEVVGS